MEVIDTLLAARVTKPTGAAAGDVPVWNGSTWVRPNGSPSASTVLRGDGSWTPQFGPQAQVSASPTLTTATPVVVSFVSEDFDTDVIHDNTVNPSRLTAKTAGTYAVWANANWANFGTGVRYVAIGRNGGGAAFVNVVAGQANPAGPTTVNSWQSVYGVVVLAANDYIELSAYHEQGANLTPSLHFGLQRIG